MARSEHHPTGFIHYNPQLACRGYTLFNADRNRALLMDMEGRFVHQWQCPLGVTNPQLLPNGNLLALAAPSEHARGQRGLNGQPAACYELDWDGRIVWRYDDPWIHHDYERLPSGNTLILKWAPLPKALVRRVKGGYVADGDNPRHNAGRPHHRSGSGWGDRRRMEVLAASRSGDTGPIIRRLPIATLPLIDMRT